MTKPFLLLIALLGTLSGIQPGFAQYQQLSGRVYSLDTAKSRGAGADIAFKIDTDLVAGACIHLRYDLKNTIAEAPCKAGTITDINGNFSLSVPIACIDRFHYLEISSPGYATQILPLSAKVYDTLLVAFLVRDNLSGRQIVPIGPLVNKEARVSKPAIYLYPTHSKTAISVKHTFKGKIGTTYPAYGDGWEVIADTNGTLYNIKDQRHYEYLFWDGTYRFPAEHFNFRTGFVVKKEESQAFLWEKLAFIGLNNKEINDFVVYWLPQLEQNEQNFIHFRINDDIDHSSTLTVSPEPESRIRLFMEFKPVPVDFSIRQQQLQTLSRKGFTLVEWGGAKLEKELSVQ